MAKDRRKKETCPNCKETIGAANFCSNCGQENTSKRASLKYIFNDFLGDYFTFDSKLLSSIVPLIVKPGFLTLEFINERRARYIPPLRMYLFISIVYFFVTSFPHQVPEPLTPEQWGEQVITFERVDVAQTAVTTTFQEVSEGVDSLGVDGYIQSLDIKNGLAVFIAKAQIKGIQEDNSIDDRVQKGFSLMMFLLMPFFGWVLKWFYGRKFNYYIDHLVFSFHFHSFLFLFSSVYWLAALFTVDFYDKYIVLAVAAIYLFIAMLKAYGESVGRTVWKFLLVSLIYMLIFIMTFATTLIISIATY